ncbi:MAG: GNAT family N-acetyltransferase [Patescibacteria group bacterium]
MESINYLILSRKDGLKYQPAFIKVYQEVFAGPPYFETYSDEEVIYSAWDSHLEKGCIVLAMKGDEVIGLGCCIPILNIMPGEANEDVKNLFFSRLDSLPIPLNRACYMSELAVLSDFRGLGIGTELIRQRWSWAKSFGLSHYIVRTAAEGSNSVRMYKHLGAKEIDGLVQDVTGIGVESKSRQRIFLYGEID